MESLIEITEKDRELYGTCVISTLESMLSEIAGKPLKIEGKAVDFRIGQMKKAAKMVDKRLNEDNLPAGMLRDLIKSQEIKMLAPRLAPATVRMDKMATSRFIEKLRETKDGQVGRVLNQCEIRYVKGDLNNAREYIDQGWSVGVVTCLLMSGPKVFEGSHVFHLGINDQGRLIDKSDGEDGKYMVESRLDDGRLNINTIELQKLTGGWNLILIRKKNNQH